MPTPQEIADEFGRELKGPQFGHSPNYAPIHEERAAKFARIFERAGTDAAYAGMAGGGIGLLAGGPPAALGLGATSALSAGAVGGGLQAWREFGPASMQIPEEVEPAVAFALSLPGAGAAKVASQMGRYAPSVANWLWQNRALGLPVAGSVLGPLAWAAANREYWPDKGHIGAGIAGAVLGLGAIGAAALGRPAGWRIPVATTLPSVGNVLDKYTGAPGIANTLSPQPQQRGGTRLEVDPSVPAGRTDPNTGQPFGQPIPLD